MSIESPETYGEHFWGPEIDVQKALAEVEEKAVAPFIPRIFTDPEVREAMPFDILSKLENLLEFPSPGLADIGGRFVSEVADQTVGMVMTPALRKLQYAANRQFLSLFISPDAAANLHFRKWIADSDYELRMRSVGYSQYESDLVFMAAQPFPGVPDLIRWARYHGNPENTWQTLEDKVTLDSAVFPIWDWLGKQVLTTDQITAMFRRELVSDGQADDLLMQTGWNRQDAAAVRDLSFVVPNAMLLMQGDLHAGESEKTIFDDLGKADIHPAFQRKYYDAVLTKPAPADIISWHLRQESSISQIEDDLQKIGIHPEYLKFYELLTDRIPPLNDLITMAVREAFSPGTARRFGQYEDFPREFAEYAAQQGLSREWAERYWAAHWGLPSITQGFDMLHRGIIERDDLVMLLKAQDVMPYWRERLIQMAYKPLTRVDVRRMFQLGVLNRSQVYEAFLELGYDQDKAQNMTEYVEQQTAESMIHTARDDIVKAFTGRIINRPDAHSMLRGLRIPISLVEFMLDDAEYKRHYTYVNNRIKAVQNLYRKKEYDDTQAQQELLKLDIPTDQVEVLMEQWYFTRQADGTKPFSKAESLKFLKQGLIKEPEARKELSILGYDDHHISIYLRSIEWESQNGSNNT